MRRNLILIFSVLLGLSWFTAISEAINNPKKVEAFLAKASELEAQGIYVDAITEYENALAYQPNDVEISLKMANAYLQTGSSKKFVSTCKKIAETNQKDTSAMDCLMEYYAQTGNEATAVKYLSEFTEKFPKNETAQKWMIQFKGSYDELFCNYEEFSGIYNNSMVVKQSEKYGLTDGMGNEIVSVEYDEVHPFSEDDLALVLKEGAYIYIDRDGQTRLAPDASYQNLGMMSSGRTIAAVNGKYGYLDERLQPVTEFLWDNLTLISDGIGAGQQNGKWAILNKNGKPRTEYLYEDVIIDENGFCSGQKRIFVKEQGTYHLVDKKGKMIGELAFDNAHCFSESGYAAVCKDGKWGFIDAEGELVLDYQYEDAQSFHNGFAAVCKDGKWGYIDEHGILVIEPQFDMATPISDIGTATVNLGEWVLIQLNIFK